MALSPWPNAGTAGRTAAVAKLRRVIPHLSEEGVNTPNENDDIRACELGEMASDLVEKYAPGAPDSVRDEACIRLIGYLAQSSSFGAIRKGGVGPLSIEYQTNHAAMFRNCGAQALLTHWKIRRAGVIKA